MQELLKHYGTAAALGPVPDALQANAAPADSRGSGGSPDSNALLLLLPEDLQVSVGGLILLTDHIMLVLCMARARIRATFSVVRALTTGNLAFPQAALLAIRFGWSCSGPG